MKLKLQKKILMAFDWYDTNLHAGVAEYAKKHNWNLNTHMARTRQFPLGWEGDGVVSLLSQEETLNYVRDLNLPTVDMGGHFSDFPQVLGDHYKIGSMAAEHFLERNHKNFIFFKVQNSRLEKEILNGFEGALESAGYSCQICQWSEKRNEQQIRYADVTRWVNEQLPQLPRPLAVFCQNDDTAALILNAAINAGITIPDDVAILGAGNSELVCDFLPIRLSSIGANLRGHGYELAHQLDLLLQGNPPPRIPIRIPPGSVHLRESTDFLAVTDVNVKRVLREIWDNYGQDITIERLQALVPISRSSLYNIFIKEVGHPMAKELTRIRIIRAKQLLRETNDSISFIAEHCGFNSGINFSRAFSKNTGMSPMNYRQNHNPHWAQSADISITH